MDAKFKRGDRVVYEVTLTTGPLGRFVGTVTGAPVFYGGCYRYTVRDDATGRDRDGCEEYRLRGEP